MSRESNGVNKALDGEKRAFSGLYLKLLLPSSRSHKKYMLFLFTHKTHTYNINPQANSTQRPNLRNVGG